MKSGRILIVVDAPFLRSVVRSVAEEAGWSEITETDDAEQVLRLAREFRPQFAVLDLHIPRGGLNLLAALRQLEPGLQVVALAPLNQKELARGAIRSGAAAVVTKPFAREHLLAVLSHLA